jgi:hypothetical protein
MVLREGLEPRIHFLRGQRVLLRSDRSRRREKRCAAKFRAAFATPKRVLEVPVPRKKEIGFHARPGTQKYSH